MLPPGQAPIPQSFLSTRTGATPPADQKTMKTRLARLTVVGILAALSARAASAVNPEPEVPVVWDSPSADARGSMPIGNGDIGANVWVEPSGDLILLLSKTDAWDEVSRLVKLGRLRIKLPTVKNFKQELRTADGEIRITADGLTVRVWIDANHPVVRVELDNQTPFTPGVAHETWRTHERLLKGGEIRSCWGQAKPYYIKDRTDPVVRVYPDTVLDNQSDRVVFFHRNPTSVWTKNLRDQQMDAFIRPGNDPLMNRTFGAVVTGDKLVNDGKSRLTAESPQTRTIITATVLTARTATAGEWVDQVTTLAAASGRVPLEEARGAHRAWWRDFWNRSWIHASGMNTLPVNEQPWGIGCDSNGGSRFRGSIAGARVLDRVLSPEEIAALAAEQPSVETRLVTASATTAGTLVAWIKPVAGESGRILDKVPLGKASGILLDAYPKMALRLIVGGDILLQPDCLQPGEWQHVAATMDAASGARRIYLNGKLLKEERRDSEAAMVSRAHHLQRWVNACAGRGGAPIKFNGSIFNVECVVPIKSYCGICNFDADFREWGNPYWWQNTRLIYWAMPMAGDSEFMRAMLKMYMDALPLRKAATQAYFKHDGAFFPEIVEFWGASFRDRDTYQWDPANPRAAQLWSGQPRKFTMGAGNASPEDSPPGWYWQSGIEMIAIMLAYCDYSGDTVFRDQKLLPFAWEILRFYEVHWPRDSQGKIHFFPLSSLEAIQNATNPMPEIAGLHFVLPQLIACTAEEPQKAAWQKMLADLPPLPVGNRNGNPCLLAAEKGTRHSNHENPEFYAVWPYEIHGVGKKDTTPALNAWPLRRDKVNTGWSQNAIHAAMLGMSTEAKNIVVSNFKKTSPGFRFPGFYGPNYDWTPDQDHACVNMIALQRMLLQSAGDKILLLPAWPKEWNASFKLHAPKQTIVEGRVENGKIVDLKITPDSRKRDVEICQPSN